MDPISFSIELEIGSFLIAMVGGAATWLHHRHTRARRSQRERHFQQMRAARERHHQEHMQVLRKQERAIQEGADASARMATAR